MPAEAMAARPDHSHLAQQAAWGAGLPLPAWWAALALVLVATWLRGGNRGVALMVLEPLALVFLATWLWRCLATGALPAGLGQGWRRVGLLGLAAAPAWVAVLQGFSWPGLGAASAMPVATAYAALAGLPLAACLLAGLSASVPQLRTLLRLWVAVAVAQALFGLVQLGGFEALHFGGQTTTGVHGTYASRNTYANLLAMALPLALLQLLAPAAGGRQQPSTRAAWGWGLAAFALLAAVLASSSRTGIATALLVSALALVLLPSARRGPVRWPWLLAGAAALLLLALMAGGVSWVERFDAARLVTDDEMRSLTRAATWRGAMANLPWGVGLGAYAGTFPAWQSPEVGRYLLDLAHNDYLQLYMELGMLWVLALGVLVALLVQRSRSLWWALARARATGHRRAEGDVLALAAALGLLATALHAWVDYPLRIPANAMLASFLLGLLLREPAAYRPGSGGQHGRHTDHET